MEKQQQFWEKFLESQITKTVAIVMATMAVTTYFNSPSTENSKKIEALEASTNALAEKVQNIKDNDIHEIHLSTGRIEDEQKAQGEAIVKLQTIIEERIPPRK